MAYSSFHSMKWVGVLPLSPVHCKVNPQHFIRLPWQFTGTRLYSWVERSSVRRKCFAQEHNYMARSWTWTCQPRGPAYPPQPHRIFHDDDDNECEYMEIIYVNCGLRCEYESDLHSNEHYLSSSENKAWKNSGLYGVTMIMLTMITTHKTTQCNVTKK